MPVSATSYAGPTFIELVPEELDIRVFGHQIDTTGGPVACWSYVTDGLRRYGQRDVVFTLRRRSTEPESGFPRDPLDFFQLLLRQAKSGKVVESGGYSRFARAGGFLGREGAAGMTYMPASPLKGVNYPDRMLAAHLVSVDEIEAIRAHGSYRHFSLLGFRNHFFPFPPWSDRDRKPTVGARDVKASLLGQIPVASAPGLAVRRQRNQIHLHIPDPRSVPGLEKRLDAIPPGPIALLTDPDAEAKARLVWKPDMSVETIAIDNRPEATLTGGFVAFVPGAAANEGAHVCEDGFVMQLRPATWKKVRAALLDQEPLAIEPTQGGMRIVCGLDSHVEAVRQVGSRPMHPEEVIRARMRPEEHSWFDRRICHVVEDHFGDVAAGDGAALTVFCAIRPGQGARFWIDCRPDELPPGGRTLLLRRLAALKPPSVTAPVAWGVQFELWGGTGNPADFVPLPAEWSASLPPHLPAPATDLLLDRFWPAT